ncbi:uncharacterized protein EAE98_006297 [Botrytis deweyae]|uniref:Uncharacterized protein n=1 Tax=Botrytis deweyae TaxID=2478750 RepID=A0ABQ7IKH6_9HELO|nr:uncharacterized protein EAE98_006297 [Botrytis deweyae]KAF7926913.1 hypothetical protein EAE98_006297 [Botrytis deweyae]
MFRRSRTCIRESPTYQTTYKHPKCSTAYLISLPVLESRFDWSIVKSVEVMVDLLDFASSVLWFCDRLFDGRKKS